MAQISITEQNGNYYTVRVTIAEAVFEQILITDKVGEDLTAMLMDYAADYERGL